MDTYYFNNYKSQISTDGINKLFQIVIHPRTGAKSAKIFQSSGSISIYILTVSPMTPQIFLAVTHQCPCCKTSRSCLL